MNRNPSQPRRSLWDTPQGAAALRAPHARLIDALRAPNTTPTDRARAWASYRRERFTETGLENMTGTQATYHFDTGFGGALIGAASALASKSRGTRRHKFDAAMRHLQRCYGYRWEAGVKGIAACLTEQQGPEAAAVFMAERAQCEARVGALMDAAGTLAKERAWDTALSITRAALHVFLEEAGQLVTWLHEADESGTARLLQSEIAEAWDSLRHCPLSDD